MTSTKLLVAAALLLGATSATLAQGTSYNGMADSYPPYYNSFGPAPGPAVPYGYGYSGAPYGYGYYDYSGPQSGYGPAYGWGGQQSGPDLSIESQR